MKLAKLIYNPVAGEGNFKTKLDMICEKMQSYGWQIVPFRTSSGADIEKGLADLSHMDYQAIFASGGDGTIHQVINAMMQLPDPAKYPLAVFPGGTANDLAIHLELPNDIELWCDMIGAGKTKLIDLGVANNKYFHNVCSAGLLTDVSHEVDYKLKNILGKVAYYIKGIEKLPKFRPFSVTIEVNREIISEELLLFLTLNGKSAGGFAQMASNADICDGQLEVILVRDCNLRELLALFVKLMQGKHLKSDKVLYFQTDNIKVYCPEILITDLDGEIGPDFPLEIAVKKEALRVFVPF
ncbi:MAG: YegS/Rv2252/BmrU family lipid kinase [Bacillota bacterium]|nr:YegS/Rv2252/BmrU family lipid kinase [Bacillota bacterium]